MLGGHAPPFHGVGVTHIKPIVLIKGTYSHALRVRYDTYILHYTLSGDTLGALHLGVTPIKPSAFYSHTPSTQLYCNTHFHSNSTKCDKSYGKVQKNGETRPFEILHR